MKIASENSVSKGIRILQIIVGIIAIALSIAVIINPGFGIEIIVFLLSISLFVIGIESIVHGASGKRNLASSVSSTTTTSSNDQ